MKKNLITCVVILVITIGNLSAQNLSDWISAYQKVQTLFNQDALEELLDYEEQIKPLFSQMPDSAQANLYYYLGAAYHAFGEYNPAIAYYELEKKVRAKEGTQNTDYEALLSALGAVYFEAGNYQKANHTFKELRSLDSLLFGTQDERFIQTTLDLAKSFKELGNYRQAENTYKYLLRKVEKGSVLHANTLVDYGNFSTLMGKYTQADRLIEQSLAIYKEKEGESSLPYLRVMLNKARLLTFAGKLPEAEEIFLNSMRLSKQEADPAFQDLYFYCLNELGSVVYKELGRYDEGVKLLLELKAADEQAFGAENPIWANTLNNLAALLTFQGKYDQAEMYLKESLAIIQKSQGENYLYATSLNNLSYLYRKNRKYKDALPVAQQARSLAKANLGTSHPSYALYTYNLGLLYYANHDFKQAEPLLNEAYKIRAKELGTTHPKFGESANKLANYYWKTGQYKKAEILYRETFQNYFVQIDNYFPFMSEQEKAKFYNQKLKLSFEEFNSYAISRHQQNPALLGEMYNYQLATKALIMYATNKVRGSILNSGDSLLIKKYETWIAQKEQLSKMYSMSKADMKAQGLNMDSLIVQSNLLEKELSKASSAFNDTYTKKTLTWQDIQKQLKPGEAAIEMIRFREFLPDSAGIFSDKILYAALIITTQTKKAPQLILIKNGLELENRYLSVYRNSIRYKVEERFSYDQFWKPIATQLKGVNRIYFSPDGVYNQISLNTLRNPDSGKYLIDETEVRLILNTKDLLSVSSTTKVNLNTSQATFFGFPNYNKGLGSQQSLDEATASQIANNVSLDRSLRGSLQRYIASNQLLALLPGTKLEVEGIATMYRQNQRTAETHLGDLAVEETLKVVNNPISLHIATHGFFMEDIPAAEGDENKYVENPLLRSGLIMAGANSFLSSNGDQEFAQDGILTAYEAMNLNLDKTELVVLSACQTGLGQVKNGEGVYGLQRSFQIAGAKAVIMSMWSVDDQATQELMTLFYADWLKTGNKQEAFRRAQLELKKKYSEPFYWGAFVMVGQ